MIYLVDANVFIEAAGRYYAFDICPGFWDWMDAVCKGDVASIDKVCTELQGKKDDLGKWALDRKDEPWFHAVDDKDTQASFVEIANVVQAGPYYPAGKAKFLAGADPWLIARARVIGATIVTQEKHSPDVLRRVPIPNICIQFNVPYQDTFDILRHTKASFKLG